MVRRALKSLQERGMLDISACAQELETGGRRQTRNHYYLLEHSEWKKSGGATMRWEIYNKSPRSCL